MSILSRTSRDTITIKRKSTTKGSQGGRAVTATTANRGSLATSHSVRVQPIRDDEQIEYGVRGDRQLWKVLTATDPVLTVQDEFTFTSDSGNSVTCEVIEPSRNLDDQGRLFVCVGQQISTES